MTNPMCDVAGRTHTKKLTLILVMPQLTEKTRLTTSINRVAKESLNVSTESLKISSLLKPEIL